MAILPMNSDTRFVIGDMMHPYYSMYHQNWEKWRLTYQGGDAFIERYLQKFSNRELLDDFNTRKRITYVPAFAKSAVNEIKNSIFQRMIDVSRKGGTTSYQEAVDGNSGGVDLLGSSMTSFLGRFILPELLSMSRVGIYIDMPGLSGPTLSQNRGKRPYIYMYKVEDIRCWTADESNKESEFSAVLLRDWIDEVDPETYFTTDTVERYRWLWLNPETNKVHVRFYHENSSQIDQFGNPTDEDIILNINRIPFVMARLSDSLLSDVANYQVALMNMGSSDIAYVLHSNYPFYTEQFDPRWEAGGFNKEPNVESHGQQVIVGPTQGRRYPMGMERPGFIHPSSEPIKASMEKQEQLKQEIRLLVHLAVTNLIPRMASAESKGLDQVGLEAGLSYIGLELERAERLIASYWSMYENSKDIATVNYPLNYSLKTDADNWAEIDSLIKLMSKLPSPSAQREICKQIARLALKTKVSAIVMQKIENEIDKATAFTLDPLVLIENVKNGVLDMELAASLFGYPEGTVEKASQQHAERLKRIAISQMPGGGAARGVGDVDPDLNNKEKESSNGKIS